MPPSRSLAVALLALLALGPPLAAQHGRTLSLSGGIAPRLDSDRFGDPSLSLGVAALWPLGSRLSLGIEIGRDRHDVGTTRTHGFTDGRGNLNVECPAPCTLTAVTVDERHAATAWHVGPVLRFGARGGSFAPFAELGVGFYLVEDATGFDARDASTGARDSALTLKVSDTQPAPGFGLALGADWFPNGGRLGFGVAGRIRAAGLPIEDHDDSLSDAIFAALQARIILR